MPNWSFEQYDTCPNTTSQINFATNWFQPNLCCGPGGSTDYYNQCAPSIASVPTNWIGFQSAKTGVAYAGLCPYYSVLAPDRNREYLETQLDSALVQGQKYCVEFYVSLAEKALIAVDAIGAHFSAGSITNNNISFPYLPFSPQINTTGNIISDTINWVKISGQFIAAGGERFMTIGNFNTGANTNVILTDSLNGFAYYYIDDVSVYECNTIITPEADFFIPNAFSPNGDGANDVFTVRGDLTELNCVIFNRWGEKVAELAKPKEVWDGTINGQKCSTGVYFYYLIAKGKDGKEITEKGNLTLLR